MTNALILMASLVAGQVDDDSKAYYRALSVGDWVEYKSTNAFKEIVLSKQTVLAKTENEITMKIEQSINGKAGAPIETKINLKLPIDPSTLAKDVKTETETLGSGKETIKVGDKTYDCEWERKKTTFTYKDPKIPKTEIISKRWSSKDLPFGGTVKVETTVGEITTVTELNGYGKSK